MEDKIENTKKRENWEENCKDCEVLKLDMFCEYGCDIIRGSIKTKEVEDNKYQDL